MDAPEFLTIDGRILLVQSSLSDIDKTLEKFDKTGLKARVVIEVKFPFETIALIEAKRATGI
jgi:release factor glutamine methyltransferase